jgi:hypothetical protein
MKREQTKDFSLFNTLWRQINLQFLSYHSVNTPMLDYKNNQAILLREIALHFHIRKTHKCNLRAECKVFEY